MPTIQEIKAARKRERRQSGAFSTLARNRPNEEADRLFDVLRTFGEGERAEPGEGLLEDVAGIGENLARTGASLPSAIAGQVGRVGEAFGEDVGTGVRQVGQEVKDIAQFTGEEIGSLLLGIDPITAVRAQFDPETAEQLQTARERIFSSGGLGPLLAIFGGRAGAKGVVKLGGKVKAAGKVAKNVAKVTAKDARNTIAGIKEARRVRSLNDKTLLSDVDGLTEMSVRAEKAGVAPETFSERLFAVEKEALRRGLKKPEELRFGQELTAEAETAAQATARQQAAQEAVPKIEGEFTGDNAAIVAEATAELAATESQAGLGFGKSRGQNIGGALDRALAESGDAGGGTGGTLRNTLGDGLNTAENMLDPGALQYVTTPTNYVGAVPGLFQRFGRNVATAVRKSVLAERNIRVEIGIRRTEIQRVIKDIHPSDFGKRGALFIEAFEGRPLAEILADTKLHRNTKKAAVKLRTLLERDRVYFRDTFRDNNRGWVAIEVEKAYRQKNNLQGKRLNANGKKQIRKLVDDRLAQMIPDSWGIENYFPHVFTGNHLIRLKGRVIGSETTMARALSFRQKELAKNPDLKLSDFKIDDKRSLDPGLVRVGKGRRFRIIRDLVEALKIPSKVIQEGLKGNIGLLMNRTKFLQNLKKRQGAKGFSKDLEKAMDIYNQGVTRYKHLTQLNREVQPLLETLRNDGRIGQAEYVEKVFDQVWGNRDRGFSGAFDASIQAIPGLRNYIAPFALDRWAGTFIKTPVAALKWKYSIRGQALNSVQMLQTTMAVVTPAEFVEGMAWGNSTAGRAVRKRHGVEFFGGKQLEGQSVTGAGLRAKAGGFAPVENFNQANAFSIMYRKAQKKGMSDIAAADYAFLRGNLGTQFLPMRADVPPVFRGVFPSTIGMFRRFGIKDMELGFQLMSQRQFRGVAKWASAKFLLGGSRIISRPLTTFGTGFLTLEAYRKIRAESGEMMADFVFYGLPGLIDLDVSYSVSLLETSRAENLPEEIGNTFLGPAGTDAIAFIKAWNDDSGIERSKVTRLLKTVVRKNPALRWMEGIHQLQTRSDKGLYDFSSPNGKLRYRNDLLGVVINALGGKTVNDQIVGPEGQVIGLGPYEVWADATAEVESRQKTKMNEIAQMYLEGTDYTKTWADWDELYPEWPLDPEVILSRAKARYESSTQTTRERQFKRLPRTLKPEFSPEVFGPGIGEEP